MSNTSKYDCRGAEIVQIIEKNSGTVIGKEDKVSEISPDEILKEFYQFVMTLKNTHPEVNDKHTISRLIGERSRKDKTIWQNLRVLKRLFNGGKKASIKMSEHFVESSLWGQGAVSFIDGLMEDPE
jgi:ribosomal protein L1